MSSKTLTSMACRTFAKRISPPRSRPRWCTRLPMLQLESRGWAAQFVPWSSDMIRVLYLHSYHLDEGSVNALCTYSIFKPSACQGHFGDSEAIALDIRWDFDSEHWVLHKAWYSQHNGYGIYPASTSDGYPSSLEYPTKLGGRPRSYSSIGKHANYATSIECGAGGRFGVDSCCSDRFEVLEAFGNANIGSNTVRLLNCVQSTHPVYSQAGATECYWTGSAFGGWTGALPSSDPYSARLGYFAFLI